MFREWKTDLKSSLVVFLVALPLCLGIALASGAPLSAGLFAGIIGGIVVGSISGSQVGVSGPAAGLTVIVLNGIATLGSFEIFAVAVFLAGIFQIIFGLIRAGKIGDYFPTAVIRGMLAAIGLILIIKQYPNALGLVKGAGFQMHTGIVIISAFSIALMLFWDKMAAEGFKFFKLIPGALVAVACSIGINALYQSFFPGLALDSTFLVQLPFHGGFSEIISMVKFPDFSHLMDKAVIQVALTIAIVASLETLLCVDAADKIDPAKRVTSKDRELFAQGIGNALSGFIGGLPITAVIVRTTANIAAGNKTKLSAIFHGFWLISCVVMIPFVLNMIPLASLACVLL
ncbi:MAG: SulP family inorganic anion transporter, partial [Bdellovibrionales bacterium]|nr:SulP family inorganic anion transporter [Bdellovibrionales bacterium]